MLKQILCLQADKYIYRVQQQLHNCIIYKQIAYIKTLLHKATRSCLYFIF